MTLVEQIHAAGSDHLPTFGGTIEGGYHIQQDPGEFAGLVDALQGRPIKTYLQVGCAAGGTERFLCEKLGVQALDVIDLGVHPRFPVWLEHNRPALEAQGVSVRQHIGDSHEEEAEAFLAALGRKYDLIGIDGDHTPAGVRMDWALITPHVQPGTLVWFHDIGSEHLPPSQQGGREVWAILRERHKVIYETTAKFGIGLLEIV